MTSLRRYRFLPVLLAASLVLATALPLVQHACAMTEVAAGEAMAEHAALALPCHGAPSDEAPEDDRSDSQSVLSMPCCTLAAVGTAAQNAPELSVSVTVLAEDAQAPSLAAVDSHPRASGLSSPGRRMPLHIALSRFLT